LLRTATDLGRDKNYQGEGLLNVLAAVREATGSVKRAVLIEKPARVFCSYSELDKALWEELKKHLSSLEHARRIEVWSDQLIEAGQDRTDEIQKQLNTADVILLLLSANYMATDYCYIEELPRALERHAQEGTKIIPIRARPVMLKGSPLENLQALPTGAKSITAFGDPNEGWEQVAEQLHEIVTRLGK
jgi:TIR domain